MRATVGIMRVWPPCTMHCRIKVFEGPYTPLWLWTLLGAFLHNFSLLILAVIRVGLRCAGHRNFATLSHSRTSPHPLCINLFKLRLNWHVADAAASLFIVSVGVLEDPRGQFWSPWPRLWPWGLCPWLQHCLLFAQIIMAICEEC